jgi:hypothetical protein
MVSSQPVEPIASVLRRSAAVPLMSRSHWDAAMNPQIRRCGHEIIHMLIHSEIHRLFHRSHGLKIGSLDMPLALVIMVCGRRPVVTHPAATCNREPVGDLAARWPFQ